MSIESDDLGDRGIELEPDELWWPWLRTVLLINLTVSCVSVMGALWLLRHIPSVVAQGKASGRFWLTPDLLSGVLFGLALPVVHLIASVGGLKRRPAARIWMIVYCWVALGLSLINFVGYGWNALTWWSITEDYLISQVSEMLNRAVLPLITLLFITRPPIRALFIPDAKAFEVIPSTRPPRSER